MHLDGKSAPGQVPAGSVCYERNGVNCCCFNIMLPLYKCIILNVSLLGFTSVTKLAFYFLQEVFYLTYTPDDVEGSAPLETGDKVSFYMDTNKQ